jgi:hypothetical protein
VTLKDCSSLDINSLLLLTEIVLLVPTLLLLVLGRREEKGRSLLLQEITKTAKMLSRQEYFSYVLLGMQTATKSIKGSIKGSPPVTPEQEQFVEKVIDQMRLAKKNRHVTVQYLIPKATDRIGIGYRYKQGGADVRFHPSLVASDVRYTVIDDKYNVIGLPSAVVENAHTGEGYMIVSEGLAEVFVNQFDNRWSEAIDYEEYVKTVLSEITQNGSNVSVALVSQELRLPESEVKRVLESNQRAT